MLLVTPKKERKKNGTISLPLTADSALYPPLPLLKTGWNSVAWPNTPKVSQSMSTAVSKRPTWTVACAENVTSKVRASQSSVSPHSIVPSILFTSYRGRATDYTESGTLRTYPVGRYYICAASIVSCSRFAIVSNSVSTSITSLQCCYASLIALQVRTALGCVRGL